MPLGRFMPMLIVLLLSGLGAWQAFTSLGADKPDRPAWTTVPVQVRRVVLLGEVHDNAAQHALRLQAFKALLAGGARPALLMEQFDHERQIDIDRVRARSGPIDPDEVIAAASTPKAGWNWSFYRPFIEQALAHGLPIVAANVSREGARQVIAHGLSAQGFDALVPTDIESAHAHAIAQSHCGMVDATQASRMALAQIARDQFMARMIEAHVDRGVLLLAGNEHVRKDVGVPRWLSPRTRAKTAAIGLLEEGDESADAFDHAVSTSRQKREDPCEAMRRLAGSRA